MEPAGGPMSSGPDLLRPRASCQGDICRREADPSTCSKQPGALNRSKTSPSLGRRSQSESKRDYSGRDHAKSRDSGRHKADPSQRVDGLGARARETELRYANCPGVSTPRFQPELVVCDAGGAHSSGEVQQQDECKTLKMPEASPGAMLFSPVARAPAAPQVVATPKASSKSAVLDLSHSEEFEHNEHNGTIAWSDVLADSLCFSTLTEAPVEATTEFATDATAIDGTTILHVAAALGTKTRTGSDVGKASGHATLSAHPDAVRSAGSTSLAGVFGLLSDEPTREAELPGRSANFDFDRRGEQEVKSMQYCPYSDVQQQRTGVQRRSSLADVLSSVNNAGEACSNGLEESAKSCSFLGRGETAALDSPGESCSYAPADMAEITLLPGLGAVPECLQQHVASKPAPTVRSGWTVGMDDGTRRSGAERGNAGGRQASPGEETVDPVDSAVKVALAGVGITDYSAVEHLGGGRYRFQGQRWFCRLNVEGCLMARRGSTFVPFSDILAADMPARDDANGCSQDDALAACDANRRGGPSPASGGGAATAKTADAEDTAGAAVGPAEGPGFGASSMLEALYDPLLGIYYDPLNDKYYERREPSIT